MNKSEYEVRACGGLELRAAASPFIATLAGYAAKFNSASLPFEGTVRPWIEKIVPGAFSRSLREHPDVLALFSHNNDQPIARTTGGTLALNEDSIGLHFEAKIAPTSIGKDLVEMVRSKVITGMSFAFSPVKTRWTEGEEYDTRELQDITLHEISAVAFPAYPSTEIGERSHLRFRDFLATCPDIKEAMEERDQFLRAAVSRTSAPVMGVEEQEGEVAVPDFVGRHHYPFAPEISAELPGRVDNRGRWCVEARALQELCRDPEAVSRAWARIEARSDEKFAEAAALFESASRRRW